MRALSIRQPWAWLIVNGHKDIENRDWSTAFRGQVLIHAGKTMSRKYYDEVVLALALQFGRDAPPVPAYELLEARGSGWRGHHRRLPHGEQLSLVSRRVRLRHGKR